MSLNKPIQLPLDHVSLAVPSFEKALNVLDQHLGFSVTISPDDPNRHGRLMLDRSYVEVSEQEDINAWGIQLFFLGFDDPDAIRSHLENLEIDFHWGEYVGVDGIWDDIELKAGDVPLPILVRRISPPKIAANWPPALNKPHRCGATSLVTIYLTVPELSKAQDAYTRLLGAEQNYIKLNEGHEIGVSGIVFKTHSIDESRHELGEILGHPDEEGISWISSPEISRVRIGFKEEEL